MSFSLPIVLGVILAILVGVALGLLGGGGSILTLPILVYVIGTPAHEAIALSLLVVGATSVAALLPHARAGNVRWKMGALFGATSMVGAFAAGSVAKHIPGTLLLLFFGAMMLVTAAAMMRGGRGDADAAPPPKSRASELPIVKIILEGLGVGAVTGLVGAGGGFLVVPALVLLGKIPMRAAIGTSLLVITMKSFAGFAGYLGGVSVDWGLAAAITTAAVVGSFAGGALVSRVRQDLLRRGFAWFVVVMAAFILVQELPRAFGIELDLATDWPLVLGVSALPLVVALVDLWRVARRSPVRSAAPELEAGAGTRAGGAEEAGAGRAARLPGEAA